MSKNLNAYYITFNFKMTQPGVMTVVAESEEEARRILVEDFMKEGEATIMQCINIDDVESLRRQQQERFAQEIQLARLEKDMMDQTPGEAMMDQSPDDGESNVFDISQFQNKNDPTKH